MEPPSDDHANRFDVFANGVFFGLEPEPSQDE